MIKLKLITALYNIVIKADFKTTEKKFLEQGIDKETIENYFIGFKRVRDDNKIRNVDDKNIDLWGSKPFAEFSDFVDHLLGEKSIRQQKKSIHKEALKIEGADLVADDDNWVVYFVKTYEASEKLGSRNWCIVREKEHWTNYASKMFFYYFLSKKLGKEEQWFKIAKAINKSDCGVSYWDNNDKEFKQAPSSLKLPDIKDWIYKLGNNVNRVNDLNELPDGIVMERLVLKDIDVKSLPKNSTIKNLDLSGNKSLKKLPEHLIVDYLTIGKCDITELPKTIKITRELNVGNSDDIKLPDNLEVKSISGFHSSKISKLPTGLSLDDLDLTDSPIKELPKNLKVGRLNCGNLIDTLPEDLNVKKLILGKNIKEIPVLRNPFALHIEDSPIEVLPEGIKLTYLIATGSKLKKLPKTLPDIDVPTVLEIEGTEITELPNNMSIENLDLADTKVKELPPKLSIAKDLTLNDIISVLPEGLQVSGRIYLSENQVKEIPKHLKSKIREFH